MDLGKLKEMASAFPVFLKEQVSAFSAKLFSLTDQILELPLVERLLGNFSEDKRRLILFGFGAFVLLFLILIVLLIVNPGKPRGIAAPEAMVRSSIPPEQLFIPAEPYSIPEFLLEREPRRFWTMEDIRPYWRNPEHPELWRNEIRTAVDELLEGVR